MPERKMNLGKLKCLWPGLTSLMALVPCLLAVADGFVVPAPAVSRYHGTESFGVKFTKDETSRLSPSTSLFAKKPYKNRPSDRYSSSTVAESELADHIQQLYSDGTTYKKTIRKTQKAQERATETANHKRSTIPTNNLLNELNRYPALILNADYQPMSYLPLSVCHWQEAIKSIFSGKVTVVDVYEGVHIRAANIEIPLPSVVALNEYVPHCSHRPAFTRRNVFLRDEYTCQYCSQAFPTKDLSIDHVVPRSMGGCLNWENAVTSCLKCNGRKGSMLVRDLKSVGMKLQTQPRAPTRHELAKKAGKMLPRKVHPTWKPYLGLFQDEAIPTPNIEEFGGYQEVDDESDDISQVPAANSKKKSVKKRNKSKNAVSAEREMQTSRVR